jgi:glycosyltransferase involved in cell wall biosynthesis
MDQETIDISVVIPVFNRPLTIRRALDSVRAQTLIPREILVVDDGSTDNTPEILNEYLPEIRIITRENGGVAAARNSGILAAGGTWIAFLDSDDVWLPDKLEKQADYLRVHPEVRILQTEERWIRKGTHVNPPKKYKKKGGNIFIDCLSHCIVGPSTVMCRKDLLEEHACFDTSLSVCEDYDLWLRIAAREAIPLLQEELTLKFGGHSDQLSLRYPAMDRFRVLSLEKILLNEPLDDGQKEAVRGMLLKKLIYLRDGARRRGTDPSRYEKTLKMYETGKKNLRG